MLLFVPMMGVTVATAALLTLTRDLPDVSSLAQLPIRFQPATTTTRLYAWDAPDAGGLRRPVLLDEIADPRLDGGWLPFDAIPPAVVDAHLAPAGPRFLTEASPSLTSDLVEWRQTGTIPANLSPITAALIRDHLRHDSPAQPGDTRRAFQDWLLGRQIDSRYSRAQQLEWALNTAYYGRLAYGIEAAARVYFGKSAAELDAAEAALLAAVARDPAANPFDDPEAALRGRAAVLDAMVAAGTMTPEQAAAARHAPLALASPPGGDSVAPEFTRLARRELEAILGPEQLLAGGFQVETTLDLPLQAQAACLSAALAGEPVDSGGGPPCPALDLLPATTATATPDTPAGIVALDPATGAILALAGDTGAARPLGTLAQPLIYLTALSQGHSAATLTMDIPAIYLQDGQPYSPRNAGGQFLGPMRLREAVVAGRLVPATEVLSWVGVNQVLATARELGLRPDTAAASPGLAFAGDGFPATLLDVGQAFATIGHDGITAGFDSGDGMPRPATIRRVVDAQGEEIYNYDPARREALSPELAWLLTDMLADRESGCPASGCDEAATLPGGRRVAVATGESAAGDGWAIGYTPELLVGALAGGADAAPVQRALLAWATAGAPSSDWPRPAGLRGVDICEVSGLLPRSGGRCPIVREWFAPGTEPAGFDTMVREVAINPETGRLATIFTPPQLIERRTYIDYPPAAAVWAGEAGIEPVPTEYDTIRRVPARVGAAELVVEPWSVISGRLPVVGSAGGEDFAWYRLAWFPGLLPEAMQTIVARGETPVDAAELGAWDTTLLDDGLYTLLLTVVRQDGTFDEVAIPVTVSNEGDSLTPAQ